MGRLIRKWLGIANTETSFVRRGFAPGDPPIQSRLEQIGQTFVWGYNAALHINSPAELAEHLATVESESQGFAFEGAAMGLMLQDLLIPWNRGRWLYFSLRHGATHIYMMYVGAGWALARLHRREAVTLQTLNPLLSWLAYDGYGFHEGYFHPDRFIEQQALPHQLSGYALRAFDQGLGRSLWFVHCASSNQIARTIAGFPHSRQADLWSGIGLACAYAGGVGRSEIELLQGMADSFRASLAQGAAFAAKARQRAGNPAPQTELACQVLSGLSATKTAAIVDATELLLPPDGNEPSYEVWRQRIKQQLTLEVII